MKKDLYSIDELTDSIIEEFELDMSLSTARRNYYQKIYRVLHELGIYERAVKEINPKTKRKERYYTDVQRKELLNSESLYNYIINNSTSDRIKKRRKLKEIQEEIEARRKAEIELLNSLSNNYVGKYDDTPSLSEEEYNAYKRNMMLTALFEKFFTPIRDDLLMQDLLRVELCKDELSLEVEDINAEDRLKHPEGIYYRKRSRPK